jgi:hypothetical protein
VKALALALGLLSVAPIGFAYGQDAPLPQPVGICRTTFPDSVRNPSAAGGWYLDAGAGTLCLYGTLERVDVGAFRDSATQIDGVTLVLRSAGGPVSTWLSIAEALFGKVGTVIVDEACFSSCADYGFPLGRTVQALPETLVVWHGGPVEQRRSAAPGGHAGTIDDLVDYDDLARRTTALYGRLHISTGILSASGRPPSQEKFIAALRKAGLASLAHLPVSGYAFSPDRLRRCFGFATAGGMWHAGGDAKVLTLGQRRSAGLVVLESPFTSAAICR